MINKLKTLFSPFYKRRKLKRLLKENSKYLNSGTYLFDKSLTYLVKKDQKLIDFTNELFHDKFLYDKNKIMVLIRKMFSKGKIKLKGQKENVASVMLLTNSYKSIKMFDFKNSLIINKFLDKDYFVQTINNNNYFSKYFNVPKIINSDIENLVLVEEFINYKQASLINDTLKDSLINVIFNDYLNYFKAIKNQKTEIYKELVPNNYQWLPLKEKNLGSQLPFIKMMGDLMYKNIMLSDDKFYYIDFEVSNEKFFLYDIFTFMFSSYMNNNENRYFKEYIKGSYDDYLSEMFELFGLNYDKDLKIDYFKIYLNERITYEKDYLNSFDEFLYINKFKELISENVV